jgi:hypothetical protein
MEHYVTLFDSLFLPQGIALHRSLERWAGAYTLWILCLDDTTDRVLAGMRLPNVRLLRLRDVETPELARVKPKRTRAEYCWTLTPFAPRFVFEADPLVHRVTYIDADLWYLRSPTPIFSELDATGKSVLITSHGYSPEYDQSATNGRFCVQFVTFVRDGGETVRKWWEERCIEWCFARAEDGKFGDQKYLDDWPQRFSEQVHVLQQEGWILAPWNATRFPLGEALIYHFHGLRLLTRGRVAIGAGYAIPPAVMRQIYDPYQECLRDVVAGLRQLGFDPPPQQHGLGLLRAMKRTVGFYLQRRRLDAGRNL